MNVNSNGSYFLTSLFIVSAISFILFFQFNIDFSSYLGFSVSLLFLLSSCFLYWKNTGFYVVYLFCAIINLVIFLLEKYIEGYRICFDLQDYFYLVYAIALFLVLTFSLVLFIIENKKYHEAKLENFFSERKYDLERLNSYLNRFSLVGLNSFWGDGKTYLFNLLKQSNFQSYYYISICVMTVKCDTVERYIINEINAILEQNKILSLASNKINAFLKQDSFYGIGKFIIKNNSYTDLFCQLKNEIEKLDKPVLVTFEDIDRIQDKELIYKIFSLSEMLVSLSDRIKILFQYDESKLLKILEEEKIYLEKYIPHIVELTPINFRRCIKILLENEKKNKKYSLLNFEDFTFLFTEITLDFHLQQSFGVKKSFSLDVYFSIRKIKSFLDEIDDMIQKDDEFSNHKKQLITFMFIKHFIDSDFNDFSDESFSTEKLFSYGDKQYSIYELIDLFKNCSDGKSELFDKIFESNSKNLNHLIYLHYFEYDFDLIENITTGKDKIIGILNEDKKNIQIKEYNDKIDRLIKNLLFSGKSEYTNLENAVHELRKVLDNKTLDLQKKVFSDFCKSSFYAEFEKGDNSTIFKLGISNFLPIFQGFEIYEKTENYWIKLIDFYIAYSNISSITASLIHIFNHIAVFKRNVFIYVLQKFNSLEIVGNLNDTECYPKFLKKYVGAFSVLGYIDTRIIDVFSFDLRRLDKNKKSYFELYCTFTQRLRELRKESPLQSIKDECNILLSFLKKNVYLILSKKTLKEYTGGISTNMSIKDGLEEIFEKLDREKLDKQSLLKYMEDEYKQGTLSANDVNRIYKRYLP